MWRVPHIQLSSASIDRIFINNRIELKIEELLTEGQFGFRGGRGTREAMLAFWTAAEKKNRKNKAKYTAFVKAEKGFENLLQGKFWKNWTSIWNKKILWELFMNEKAVIGNGSDWEVVKITNRSMTGM